MAPISSGAFAFIYLGLWGPMRGEAVKTGALHTRNASILSVLRFAHPVIPCLGHEGTNIINPVATAARYTSFNVISKVIQGITSPAGTRSLTTE